MVFARFEKEAVFRGAVGILGEGDNAITLGLWDYYSYCEKADNETTEMGGVPHVEGGLNSELYAVPVKRRQPKDQKNNATLQNNGQEKPAEVDTTDSEDKDENLPPGWQKHEGGYPRIDGYTRRDVIIETYHFPSTDENGPYYWHVKSGNIQREPPEAPPHSKRESRRSLIKDNDSVSKRSSAIYGFCV